VPHHVTLRSGNRVVIQPIRREEKDALLDGSRVAMLDRLGQLGVLGVFGAACVSPRDVKRGQEGIASWAVYGPHPIVQTGPLQGAGDRDFLSREPHRGLLGTNAIHS
jgi:hypothetical protein